MALIVSTWADVPIQLTDTLNDASWLDAGSMAITGGHLYVKNDALFLYAAFDMINDPGNDLPDGDYFWLSFDRNRSGSITPYFDTNYGVKYGNPNALVRQYYIGPGTWTGIFNEVSASACLQAFEASPSSASTHRVWKMRIKLTDINVSLAAFLPYTRFGMRVHSGTPAQNLDTPANFFNNFQLLHYLFFSKQASIPNALLGPVMGSVGLVPTTKINSGTGKATTDPGYFIEVQNAAFGGTLNIIGNHIQMQALANVGAVKYKVFRKFENDAAASEFDSSWYNYRWNVNDYVYEGYAPDASGYYKMPDMNSDYSIDDLLIQFNSASLVQGKHDFTVKFYKADNTEVMAPAQTLTLCIDNFVPQIAINSIKHGGVDVSACSIVHLTTPTDGLVFNFSAFDTEGNLGRYSLTAQWGDGSSEVIDSDSYQIAYGTNWVGVQNKTVPSGGNSWRPDETCAYMFRVWAGARTTNGYSWIGENYASRFITIILD